MRYCDPQEREGNQTQPERDLDLPYLKIKGHPKFTRSRPSVAKHQDPKSLRYEAPQHAEGVSLTEDVNVPATQQDGKKLESYDKIDRSEERRVGKEWSS